MLQKRLEEEKRLNSELLASGKQIPQKRTESVPLPPDSGSARNTLMEIARPQGSGVSEKKVGNFPTSKPTQPDKDKPRAPIIPSTNQIQRPSPQPPAPRPTAPSR